MLTLDTTLQGAQDGQTHHIIARILSSSPSAPIPMTGSVVTGSEGPVTVSALSHSSGRLVVVTGQTLDDPTPDYMAIYISNADRTEFVVSNEAFADASGEITKPAIVELADGTIGIFYYRLLSGNNIARAMIVGLDGVVDSSVTVETYGNGHFRSQPYVAPIASGGYFLVGSRFNGTNYSLFYRTSADFVTWSAETAITAETPGTAALDSPQFAQLSDDTIRLWYTKVTADDGNDNVTIDVFFVESTDDGATWGTPTNFTNNGTGVKSKTPHEIVGDTTHHLVYAEEVSAIHVNQQNDGWENNYDDVAENSIHVNEATNKIYLVTQDSGHPREIIEIDGTTFEVTNQWDYTTVPDINDYYLNNNVFATDIENCGGGGPYVAFWGQRACTVLNADADTMTVYVFRDNAETGLTRNIVIDSQLETGTGSYIVYGGCYVDADLHRLYLPVAADNFSKIGFGYLNLQETGATYTFRDIFIRNNIESLTCIKPFPNDDYVAAFGPRAPGVAEGVLYIYSLSTGASVLETAYSVDTAFPYNGFIDGVILNGKFYGSFLYTSSYGQEEARGLAVVDILTGDISTIRHTWNSEDDAKIRSIELTGDGRIIGAYFDTTTGQGVFIYDPNKGNFTLYNSDTVPGFNIVSLPAQANFNSVVFRPSTKEIYYGGGQGFSAINEVGAYSRQYYHLGEYAPTFSWGDKSTLIYGNGEYAADILYNNDDNLMAFWLSRADAQSDSVLKYADASLGYDLTGHLVQDTDLTITRSVEGQPASLSFTLANGHLFEQSDVLSLLTQYLRKGRIISVEIGEKVSGTDYLQSLGTFRVVSTAMDYALGKYPEITVSCEDVTALWKQKNLVVTSYYENLLPGEIVAQLVENVGDIAAGSIDIPPLVNGYLADMQWADTTLNDVITEILNRFGYYLRVDVDGNVTAKQISDAAVVDHTYTDKKALLSYAPDDTFSDFVNRVVVEGEEENQIEVLHDEERVGQGSGSVGWWGCTEEHDVYYSTDKQKQVRYPRLVKVETASSIAFQLAGDVSESISYEDPEDKFCTVKITAPNLVPMLAAAIGTYVVGNEIGDAVVACSETAPVGRKIEGVGIILALNILGSIANYRYEVWGRPVGYVRRSIQGSADDLELQQELGTVIEERIKTIYTSTILACNQAAAVAMMVKKMQRKRVSLSKVAHMQDEDGDTITVPHPYSGYPVNIYIAKLERKLRIGKKGYFIDNIEGWRV